MRKQFLGKTLWGLGLLALSLWSPAQAQTKRLVQVPISDAPSYAKRALVVGVTDYALAPQLHVCAYDAKEFAALLRTRFGFTDVTLMTDDPATPLALRPTCANLRRAVHGLLKGILPGKSEVVLFYSGHGVRYGDSDWLVPEDGDPSDISRSCVNYSVVVQALNTERPRRAFLITDACRSLLNTGNKGIESGSGFGKGLESLPLGPEVAEMLSCQPTEVSQEGLATDFTESVFTHFLVKGLEGDSDALDGATKNVTFDSLMQYVQGHVSNYVRSRFNASQVPDGRATQGRMVLARAGGVPQGIEPPVDPPLAPPPLAPSPSPLPVVAPIPVVPHLTPEQQKAADARLIALYTGADGRLWEAEASGLTVAAVQQALDAGADVNAENSDGFSALLAAATFGRLDVVGLLLDKGADVNTRSQRGLSVLLSAIRHIRSGSRTPDVVRLAIVRLLLDRGADVNSKNAVGRTPLCEAAGEGELDVVRLLLDKGADVNAQMRDGTTALMMAAGGGHADVVSLLLDKGVDINARDNIGNGTALIRAALEGHADVVKLMMDRGASINLMDRYQKTALKYALENNHADVASLLRAAGAQE